MGQYWIRVWRRAMSETLTLFGWGGRGRFAIRTGGFLLAVFAATYFGAGELAENKFLWVIYAALASTVIFLIVLVLYFIGTPHRFDRDIREDRDAIEDQLRARQITEEAVAQVQAAYDRGNDIQNSPERSLENIRAWCSDTEELLDNVAPSQEAWMFRTVEDEAGRLGESQILPLRLNKLRRIIARMSAALDSA